MALCVTCEKYNENLVQDQFVDVVKHSITCDCMRSKLSEIDRLLKAIEEDLDCV